jgi:hypothetical protein
MSSGLPCLSRWNLAQICLIQSKVFERKKNSRVSNPQVEVGGFPFRRPPVRRVAPRWLAWMPKTWRTIDSILCTASIMRRFSGGISCRKNTNGCRDVKLPWASATHGLITGPVALRQASRPLARGACVGSLYFRIEVKFFDQHDPSCVSFCSCAPQTSLLLHQYFTNHTDHYTIASNLNSDPSFHAPCTIPIA